MVKQYGELYLDTRRALLAAEDPQTAGMMARQLLCHATGKTQEEILSHRELYASGQAVAEAEAMCWGSGSSTA